jgi:hypothetical protein
MKLRFILIMGLCALIHNLKAQSSNSTLSVFGSIGRPIGKADFSNNNVSDIALFSNFSIACNIGVDYTFRSYDFFGYGLYTRWNKYMKWNNNDISDRFLNSSLWNIDLGPSLYFNIKSSSAKNKFNRMIIVPFISYSSLSNPDSVYNLYSDAVDDKGQNMKLVFEKEENTAHLTQLIPGIYIAYDWSVYINEKARLFVRPGFKLMINNSDSYPDKYILLPSVSLGYMFDNQRNKKYYY